MNKNKRFDLFIIGGFAFLIVLVVAISLLGFTGLINAQAFFRQTYTGPVQTWVETEQAGADLISLHRAMKDVALSRTDAELQSALNDAARYDASIRSYFSRMTASIPGDPFTDDIIKAYEDWAPIRARTIDFVKSGQYELAADNTRSDSSDQVKLIAGKMQQLVDRHKTTADDSFKASEDTASLSIKILLWMTLLAAALAVLNSLFVRGRLLRYQKVLHEENEKLHITFNSIGDGIITTDVAMNIVSMNKVAEEFTGWNSADAVGKPFTQVFDIMNALSGERANDPVEEVVRTDRVCLLENHTILTSKDGTRRHIADSAAPIKDPAGRTAGVVMIFRDVTERKIAEKMLKESEEKFRTIFMQSPIGICITDSLSGRILEMNERFAQVSGRSSKELYGIDWMSITHPDDLEKDLEQTALMISGKIDSFRIEKRYIKPDGAYVWINMSVARLPDLSSGNVIHVCMAEDITQQKVAENDLRISEERLKSAQAIANVGNWEINLNSKQVWASEQAFRIYGIAPYQPFLPLKAVQDAVIPEDRAMMDEALRSLWEKDKPYDVQFQIKRAEDGALRYVRSTAVTVRGADGTPLKIAGIIQDITKMKNAELALAQSNMKLEATLQATADGIEAVDIEGNYFFFNTQFKNMWGIPDNITREELFEHITTAQVTPDRSLNGLPDLFVRLETEPSRELNLKDGRTYERFARPIKADGIMKGFVLSYRDITQKKRSEQALQASEARHRAMIANISDTIVILDENGGLSYISPNLEELFGWRQEDLSEEQLFTLINPDDLGRVMSVFDALFKVRGMKKTLDFRLLSKYDGYKHIRLTAANKFGDPNIRGVLMNFHDISESKKRETEILYLSYHDPLTGLYNRSFLEEECVRLDVERQLPISVIMGDINGLKLVNDAFGHIEGDKLLVEISKILSFNCRKEDILARTGGDEFCILLPQTTEEDVRAICRRIHTDCASYENKADKDALYLSISLGYATKSAPETTLESIMADAEEYMYKQKLLERKSMRSSLLSSIKTTMYEKSHLTAEHEERLVTLSKQIGQVMDLSDVQLSELELLSTLHDIGKLSIDEKILNKPGRLSEEEWMEIRRHPAVGYRIAQASPELAPIAEYILCHHERWDGDGYPQGLRGEAIPLLSRIVAVVDAYDAMTQDRPYRRAMSEADAALEIESNAGTQFDPEVVRIFAGLPAELSS